jgi:glycosyltransferase involved in cell wall biosynthesis
METRKKRIMFCGEASFLNTGYSTYTREVLNYLHSTNKFEIAELACYGQRNDPRGMNLPWKYYGVQPNRDFEPVASQHEQQLYESNPINQFGSFIFESACLDFRPDIIFDIRDYWMTEFIDRSPFRKYFKWVLMPTVDAEPQARQWISMYSSADAVFSYSEWAGEILEEQSAGKIKYVGTAPPSASEEYRPIPKNEARRLLGLNPNLKIVGTVMRNQRRKLYPDLFIAFKKFLENVEDPQNCYLYCHTSYPDLGWDIPELLQEHSLSSKVLFTYLCKDTGRVFASLFSGQITQSPYTGNFNAEMCNVKVGASCEQLAHIMNCFDVYVQYANSEGFGLPQAEAAACGIPVMATNYSAMKSVVKNLEGIPLEPKALYKELETGCMRAVPDNDLTAQAFLDFFELSDEERSSVGERTRQNFLTHYNWTNTGKRIEKVFDDLNIEENNSWLGPPIIKQPHPKPTEIPQETTFKELARWLIVNVLCEPDKLNTYFEARLIRDLTFGNKTSTVGGMYHNESSAIFDGKITRNYFDFNNAYDEMISICNNRNFWEQKRIENAKGK